MKLIQMDTFRDNTEESPIQQARERNVSSSRLGWYSWKKLKVQLSPSLHEIEENLKDSIGVVMKQLLDQNGLG